MLIKIFYFCHSFFRNVSWETKYNIEFKGLKEGVHDFEFEVNDQFFAHFEESPVNNGELAVKVMLEKRSTFLKLELDLTGWMMLTCDRCLELYKQPVENNTEIFVKFGEERTGNDEEDNIIWLSTDDHQVNLVHIIYEYAVLSIPLRHVHPKNSEGKRACNPEMIAKLKKYTQPAKDEEVKTDPRWDALRKLGNYN